MVVIGDIELIRWGTEATPWLLASTYTAMKLHKSISWFVNCASTTN
ncbi:MAG: hypothetical protein QF704_11570 [Anaerolineales bacterium]|nr:hypothetical protein [Anaerolineales bacterium]